MMKYVIGVMLVVFIWIIVFGKIYLHITYKGNNAGDSMALQVSLGKFFCIYSIERKNIIDTFLYKLLCRLSKGRSAGQADMAKPRRQTWPTITSLWESTLKLRLEKFKIFEWGMNHMYCRVKLSSGDAAQTAILFGCLQAVRGAVMELLNRYAVFKETPQIAILPDFNTNEKEVYVDCIVSVKIGNIIHMLKFYVITHWREKHG